MSKNLFETHWTATKTALCEGLTGNRKKVMEVVLENTRKELEALQKAIEAHAGDHAANVSKIEEH